MHKVKGQKILFKSYITIEEGTLEYEQKKGKISTYTRERVKRDNASCVLIHNTDRNSIILTRQFRYAIHDIAKGPILEVMAGKVPKGEDPLEGAIREAEEECGYRIRKENIRFINSVFASPGYTTEKLFIYYARVTDADKVSDGGGLEEENEYIEVVELPLAAFLEMASKGQLEDSKTFIAALWLKLNIQTGQ